jgi:hypothetical protein
LAIEAGLFFEIIILDPPAFREMGLLDAAVGGGLGPRQHFRLDDPSEETQVAEFQLRGLA